MRYSNVRTGLVAVLVALSASVAVAANAQRDAISKANVNYGRNQGQTTTRAYSYVPQATVAPAVATPVAPADNAQASKPSTSGTTRSFSYQSTPGTWVRANNQPSRDPVYFHADHKMLGQY